MSGELETSVDLSTEDEIIVTRSFDAPRERVFEAMIDPKQVVQWWGPIGFTTTIHEMDVKPGGIWKLTMHGPDGTNYPNKMVFREILRPERIVYVNSGGAEGEAGATFVGTWIFEDVGERRTRLTMRLKMDSGDERNIIVEKYGAIEGGKQTLGRLAAHLATLPAIGNRIEN